MCELCEKVRALDYSSHLALEPVKAALARLHNRIGPLLDDFWLSKHDGIFEVRRAVRELQRKMPDAELGELMREVDDVLAQCVEKLVAHKEKTQLYRLHEQGQTEYDDAPGVDRNLSKDSITPSQSVSATVMEWKRQMAATEIKRQNAQQEAHAEKGPSDHNVSEKSSLIDPPVTCISLSRGITNFWMQECDAVARQYHNNDMETVSMVSELGGDSHQRPKLDVPAWKKRTVAQLLGPPSLGVTDKRAFSHSHSQNRQLYPQQAHEGSIDLDLGAKMPNRASPNGKCKLMDWFLSILHLKKKNKESKERRVEFEDAPEPLRHKAEKEDEKSEEIKRGLDHQRQKEKRKQHSMDSRAMDKNLRIEYTAQNCTDSSRYRIRREAPKTEDTEDRYTEAEREEHVPRRRVRREKAKPQRRDTDIKEKRRRLPPVVHQARPKPQGRDTDFEEKRRDVPSVTRQAETSNTRSRPSTAGNARLTSKNLRQYDDEDYQRDGSKTTESLWGSRQSAINFGSIINRHDSPDISNPPTRPPARSQHVQSTPIDPSHRLSLPTDSQARSRYQISSDTHPSEMTETSTGISRRHVTMPASIPTANPQSPRRASVKASDFTNIRERRRSKRSEVAQAPPPEMDLPIARQHADHQCAVSDGTREQRARRGERESMAPTVESDSSG